MYSVQVGVRKTYCSHNTTFFLIFLLIIPLNQLSIFILLVQFFLFYWQRSKMHLHVINCSRFVPCPGIEELRLQLQPCTKLHDCVLARKWHLEFIIPSTATGWVGEVTFTRCKIYGGDIFKKLGWSGGCFGNGLSFLKIAAPSPPPPPPQVINDQPLTCYIITCDGDCSGSTSFGSHKVD